jgi:DNA polymerase III alpha subunit
MKLDIYGNPIISEKDLLDAYMSNPDISLKKVFVDQKISIDPILEIDTKLDLVEYIDPKIKKEEFDHICQNIWLMPDSYKNLDIAKWVLEQCQGEAELQRAGKELLMYQDRDLLSLLQYLKYLVDTMRKNNIVWGVGRGSSVASFVLFLLGIHRVNSLFYELDIEEFLK